VEALSRRLLAAALMLWAAGTAGATVEGAVYAARRIRRGTQPGREDPTAALRSSPRRSGVAHARLRSRDLQRIRHAVASCCAPGIRARHHTAIVAQDASLSGGLEGTFCVRRGVECRLSNHDRGKQILRTSRGSIEKNNETLHAYALSLASPQTTC